MPLSYSHAAVLRLRTDRAPAVLDWNGQAYVPEGQIIKLMSEGLFRYDEKQNAVPALGSLVSVSKDGKEYTFKVNEAAKWSDGRPVYAQDFIDSWLRVLSPATNSIYSQYFFEIENAVAFHSGKQANSDQVGLKAIGDYVLKVKLASFVPHWQNRTAFWPFFPIRKDLILKYGNNWWKAGVLVSSGPFIYDSYEVGKRLVLKRNPHFLIPAGSNVNEVQIEIVADDQEAVRRYNQGSLSFLSSLPAGQIPNLSGRKDASRIEVDRLHLLSLNRAKFPLSNLKFRQALMKCLNLDLLLPAHHFGSKVAHSFSPNRKRSGPGHYDLAAAKKLLSESGIILNASFKLNLLTYQNSFDGEIAEKIAEQMKKNLGITVEISALDNESYTTRRFLGDYDLMYNTWLPKVHEKTEVLSLFTCNSTYPLKLCNQSLDQWVQTASLGGGNADKAFDQAEKEIIEKEAAVLPLFFSDDISLRTPKLTHLMYDPMGLVDVRSVQLR